MTERDYSGIIDHPHHQSTKHPHMTMINRAAQFSPFAALVGYDAAVEESARLTQERIVQDESALEALDQKFRAVAERPDGKPVVTVTYFIPDARKEGGSYVTVAGVIKKIDDYERRLILEDGTTIPMADILDFEEL